MAARRPARRLRTAASADSRAPASRTISMVRSPRRSISAPAARLDVETSGVQIQARGGRNNTTAESASYLDGGAGTVYLRRPGQTLGDLFAGSYDERVATSIHLTRPTPLAGTALNFDHLA